MVAFSPGNLPNFLLRSEMSAQDRASLDAPARATHRCRRLCRVATQLRPRLRSKPVPALDLRLLIAGIEGEVDLGLFTEQGGNKVNNALRFFKGSNGWDTVPELTVRNTKIDFGLLGVTTEWKPSSTTSHQYGSVSGNTFSGRLAGTATQGFLFFDNFVSIYESMFGDYPLIPKIRWNTGFTLDYDTGQSKLEMIHGIYPSFEVYVNNRLVYYDKQFLGNSGNQILRTIGLAGLLWPEINEVNFQLCDPDK